MKFSEFLEGINDELRQSTNSHLTSVADNYKAAKDRELIKWTNQSLNKLNELNPIYWAKVVSYVIPFDSDTIELPFYFNEVNRIRRSDETEWQHIGNMLSTSHAYIWMGNNKIKKVSGNFSSGETVEINGYFLPDKIVDEDSEIDIPNKFHRVLELCVMMKYFAKTNKRVDNLWSEYKTEMAAFKQSMVNVNAEHRIRSRAARQIGRNYKI